MPIEQITKSIMGFLPILTKRYQLMLVMVFTIGGGFVWLTWTSELATTYRLLSVVGILVVLMVSIFILSKLGLKEETRILREQEMYTAGLNKNLATEETIVEASQMVRVWQKNPPPDSEKGVYPYGNGVDLELKVMQTGKKYVFLHVEGRPKKKYKLN